MPTKNNPNKHLLELISAHNWEAVHDLFSHLDPADIAEVIAESDEADQLNAFAQVPASEKAEVLAELEDTANSEVLESLSASEISVLANEMAPDDAADVLGDLPEELSEEILELMEDEESADVRRLMAYDEESAGGIMTSDVASINANETIEQALQLVRDFDTHEPIFQVNIIDDRERLVGIVHLWDLIRETDNSKRLSEILDDDVRSVSVNMDQEEVAQVMSKYDLTVLPVVDPVGRLVGRITADDVMDVLTEEASEDIFRMAGSHSRELEYGSVTESCSMRMPWLFVTLLGGFVTSILLRRYLHSMEEVIILASFVPVILAMGGNTGIQSSTLVVRGLAIGTLPETKLLRMLRHEIMTGALMGSICGLLIGIGSLFVIYHAPESANELHITPWKLASIVAFSLFSAMTFAATFGTLVPILLNRLRADPAVASGPFITVLSDILALVIYFMVSVGLIQLFH